MTKCPELINKGDRLLFPFWEKQPVPFMLRKLHIEKISKAICNHLNAQKMLLVSEEAALGRISGILNSNMEAERALEDEAHKLLDKNRKLMGAEIDEQKAFMLIKRQLAKQRNFVL